MHFMDFIPRSLTLAGPAVLPIGLALDTEQRTDSNAFSVGLKLLCVSLNVNFTKDIGRGMGNMGTLGRRGDEWEMKPKPIPQQTLSAWYTGKEQIPLWRLTQAVALFEQIYVVMKDAATKANLPPSDMVWTHLDIAAKQLAHFTARDDLHQWLGVLRRALYERLKLDSARSAKGKKYFQQYASWLDTCQALEQAKANEVQTSA